MNRQYVFDDSEDMYSAISVFEVPLCGLGGPSPGDYIIRKLTVVIDDGSIISQYYLRRVWGRTQKRIYIETVDKKTLAKKIIYLHRYHVDNVPRNGFENKRYDLLYTHYITEKRLTELLYMNSPNQTSEYVAPLVPV